MSCIDYLVWDIVLEISSEIVKKIPTPKHSEQKRTTIVEKN